MDGIGGSAAGIYLSNRVRVASLFRGAPKACFDEEITAIFLKMQEEWGVPFIVINDGMSLDVNRVLGLALGSSEAGGYVNKEGRITGWLNELAFAPIDLYPAAPKDEWSGDCGCGGAVPLPTGGDQTCSEGRDRVRRGPDAR